MIKINSRKVMFKWIFCGILSIGIKQFILAPRLAPFFVFFTLRKDIKTPTSHHKTGKTGQNIYSRPRCIMIHQDHQTRSAFQTHLTLNQRKYSVSMCDTRSMMDNWYTLFAMSTFRDNALCNRFTYLISWLFIVNVYNIFSLYCHVSLQKKKVSNAEMISV